MVEVTMMFCCAWDSEKYDGYRMSHTKQYLTLSSPLTVNKFCNWTVPMN